MVTKEQARAVKQSLLPGLVGKPVSVGLSKRGEDWVVVLSLQEKFPEGTFPKEQDGVTIITEFTGEVSAYI